MSNVIIPTVPQDKQEIKQYLRNGSDSLTRIEAERDQIKSIVDEVSEKFELPKKYVRKMIKLYHQQNLDSVKQESDDLVELYEAIVGE